MTWRSVDSFISDVDSRRESVRPSPYVAVPDVPEEKRTYCRISGCDEWFSTLAGRDAHLARDHRSLDEHSDAEASKWEQVRRRIAERIAAEVGGPS